MVCNVYVLYIPAEGTTSTGTPLISLSGTYHTGNADRPS